MAPEGVIQQFTALLVNTFELILSPFFASSSVTQVLEDIPEQSSCDLKNLFKLGGLCLPICKVQAQEHGWGISCNLCYKNYGTDDLYSIEGWP